MLAYVALPIITIAVSLAFLLPDSYESFARIDVNLEGEKVRTLEPINVANYADQYIAKLRERVQTRENLNLLVQDDAVFSGDLTALSDAERRRMVNRGIFIKVITQKVMGAGGRTVNLIAGFRAGYNGPDPAFARRVAVWYSDTFLKEDRAIRTERASSTSTFLSDQIKLTEQEIVTLEKEIAEFKVANACCLPELKGLNMNVITRAERDIEDLRPRVRTLEQDRAFLQSQLDEIRAQSTATNRLAKLEEEYTTLVANYGPDHPDVAKVRREISAISELSAGGGDAELVELRMELAEKEQRYSDIHPDVVSLRRRISALEADAAIAKNSGRDKLLDNPRYQQLRARINAIDTELRTLRARSPDLVQKIAEYEDRLTRTPQVESEFLALDRKLETARQNFNNLQERFVIARQTEALESTEIGARLTQATAPYVPVKPSGPPRLAIGIIGFFLALTFGIGSVIVAELSDNTVRGAKDIIRAIEIVPIAAIPTAQNTASHAEHRRRIIMLSGTTILIIAVIVYMARYGIAQL